MSIRLRLTLWYSGLLAFTMLVLGVGIYLFVYYNTYDNTREQLRSQFKQLNVRVSYNLFRDLRLDLSGRLGYEGTYVQLVNYANGEIRSSALSVDGTEVHFPYPDLKDSPKEGYTRFTAFGYPFMAYQYPIPLPNGEVVGLLQVIANTQAEDAFLDGLRTILIITSLAVILIAFTIGLFIADKALRPIEEVIQATNRIENGANLSVRIARSGPNDEMGRLTDTLNGMLARLERAYNDLEEAYKAQRRFVSDASHELRTPLTTIRGNIDLLERMWRASASGRLEARGDADGLRGAAGGGEAAGAAGGTVASADGDAAAAAAGGPGVPADRTSGPGAIVLDAERAALSLEAMRDIAEEAERMSRLVSDLLSLARADAGYVMEKTEIELLPIVEEAAKGAVHLPRKADFRVGDLSPLEGAKVLGNADYLRQLLFIFIENAFKYTPSGHVLLRAVREADQVGLVITDTGIGMSSEEVPHIFERFYRADLSRGKTSGTGLGLAIAKWIIDEHRGSVEVRTRQGEGTTFTIWLPVLFPGEADSVIMDEADRTNE
ncbi:MAG: two-component sensor histidine kinase [Thermobacillus sp.]|uniref:sensor histidine kinase n=1 Tax=Thermobacillus sp. TaxID=2108467 RepID=UPI000E391F5D|nr:HAMP domain-containing sensor histidine kinase [Thermobacillus sp.]REK54090.1 MAG: two-component sensor histidine kinase [Thermobacillus sp.]